MFKLISDVAGTIRVTGEAAIDDFGWPVARPDKGQVTFSIETFSDAWRVCDGRTVAMYGCKTALKAASGVHNMSIPGYRPIRSNGSN